SGRVFDEMERRLLPRDRRGRVFSSSAAVEHSVFSGIPARGTSNGVGHANEHQRRSARDRSWLPRTSVRGHSLLLRVASWRSLSVVKLGPLGIGCPPNDGFSLHST